MQNGIRLKYSAVPVSGIGFKYRGPRTEGGRGFGIKTWDSCLPYY